MSLKCPKLYKFSDKSSYSHTWLIFFQHYLIIRQKTLTFTTILKRFFQIGFKIDCKDIQYN